MAKNQVCSIDNCDKPVNSRGWCKAHYVRFLRNGDPLGGRNDLEGREWLEGKSTHEDESDCLIWPFGCDNKGYGKLTHPYSRRAHRVMCMLAHGLPTDERMHAAHNCGNTSCVNPNHLRWATVSENQMDRVTHGTDARGEKHHNSKLTKESVIAIRSLAEAKSLAELSVQFGVTERTVDKIIKRQRWAWL